MDKMTGKTIKIKREHRKMFKLLGEIKKHYKCANAQARLELQKNKMIKAMINAILEARKFKNQMKAIGTILKKPKT